MLFRRHFRSFARSMVRCVPTMLGSSPAMSIIRETMATITYSPPIVKVGKKAPSFNASAVIDGELSKWSMNNSPGKYTVLLFYPKDFTFVCPTEIIAFSDRMAEFKKLNTQVVAISTDTEFSHLAWVQTSRSKGGLGFMQIPIVADTTKSISADYGVLHDDLGIALRGLFIVDGAGVTQHITINNFPIGRSVDEALRTIQAIQYHEMHGEVCPANWKPGAATIAPTVTGSLKYFEQAHANDQKRANVETGLSTLADVKGFINGNKSVVVEFMADWCGKCRQLAPFIDSLAAENESVKFAIVNTAANDGEAIQGAFGVKVLPHLKFFKSGKEVGDAIGYKKKVIKDLIENIK